MSSPAFERGPPAAPGLGVIAPPPARIGPNAIIQVGRALERAHGRDFSAAVFGGVALDAYLEVPPSEMVDEREVIALHGAVRRALAPDTTAAVARTAGIATGDYLLEHRIPKPAQRLLRLLPRALAARLLLAAIARNAWTFVGSGTLTTRSGRRPVLVVGDCPICRGVRASTAACEYYRATFERLFRALVDERTTARETLCAAAGDEQCRFELEWP